MMLKNAKKYKIQVNLSEEEKRFVDSIADKQERSTSAQVRFWILEKLRLQQEATKKETFFNGKV